MVSKFLEKKVEIVPDGFSAIAGNSFELEYYLLESENTEEEDKKIRKAYGVEIVKRHQGVLLEAKKFDNVFCSREKTRELVDMLASNTVTPSSLPYILDDLLGQ